MVRSAAILLVSLLLCGCSAAGMSSNPARLAAGAPYGTSSGIPARPLPPPVDSGLRPVVKRHVGDWKHPQFRDAVRHGWLHGSRKMRPSSVVLTNDDAGQFGVNIHEQGVVGGTAIQVVNPPFQLPYNTYVWYAPTMRAGDPSCLEATVGYFGQNQPYSEWFGFYDFCDSNAPDGFYGMQAIASSSFLPYENTYNGQTTIDYQVLYSFTDDLWHGYIYNFEAGQWEDVFDAGGTCAANPQVATSTTPGGCNLEGGSPNGGWDMSETHFSWEDGTACPSLPDVKSYAVQVDTIAEGWHLVASNPNEFDTNNNFAGTFYDWGDCSLTANDQVVTPPYYSLLAYANDGTHPIWDFSTVTSVPSLYASAVAALNPTAFYRMNETSGTAVLDSSGHGYNGTIVSPVYVKQAQPAICCSPDTSYGFINDRSYIALPATLPLTPQFTVTAMVKSATYAQKLGITCLFAYRGQCLTINENYVGWGAYGGPYSHVIPLVNGQPYLVALTVDTTKSPYAARVSVDGGPFVDANPNGYKPAVSGNSYINNSYYLNSPLSNIGEVAVFPSLLSQAQVATLATTAGFVAPSPSPAPPSGVTGALALGPLAYYRMNETGGQTVFDASPNGYDGQIVNPSYVTLGQPGLCYTCLPDTSLGFTSAKAYISLPAALPFSPKYTITAMVRGTSYAQKYAPACIVEYWSQCLTVNQNALGWGPAGGPYSRALPMTNYAPYFVALTVDTTTSPYTVNVSIDGGAQTPANPSKLRAAVKAGSYLNLYSASNQPVANLGEVAIFPYILTPVQIDALSYAAVSLY